MVICPQCRRSNPVSAGACWACQSGLPPAAQHAPMDNAEAADHDHSARAAAGRPRRGGAGVLLVAGLVAIVVWLMHDLLLAVLGAALQSVLLVLFAVWIARTVISSLGR
jgi:hypothetical protein